MSCTELLLFTNVTRVPGATVMLLGETPLLEIVTVEVGVGDGVGVGVGVGAGDGVGEGDGVVGDELPPQVAAASVAARSIAENQSVCVRIRKTFSRC